MLATRLPVTAPARSAGAGALLLLAAQQLLPALLPLAAFPASRPRCCRFRGGGGGGAAAVAPLAAPAPLPSPAPGSASPAAAACPPHAAPAPPSPPRASCASPRPFLRWEEPVRALISGPCPMSAVPAAAAAAAGDGEERHMPGALQASAELHCTIRLPSSCHTPEELSRAKPAARLALTVCAHEWPRVASVMHQQSRSVV